MPPQRHAATYRGSDRGRPAGAPCAPMLAIAAAAGLACAHVAETAKPRRASPSRARKTIHMHQCMHARAPAAGGVRSGRAAECRLPILVQREQGRRRTTRARRETPTPSGSIATKEKKNNPRTVMGARESVRVRGGRSARTLDRPSAERKARSGQTRRGKRTSGEGGVGAHAAGAAVASPARDRTARRRLFSMGGAAPPAGPPSL